MTTPTNWPNPERPGVPMFPDRDGWHVLQYYVVRNGKEMPMGDPVLNWWDANLSVWRLKPEGQLFAQPDQVTSDTVKYAALVLTPTQISEMLVGERERCAQAAQKVSDEYYEKRDAADNDDDRVYADERMCAAQECAEAIRNLGDAP